MIEHARLDRETAALASLPVDDPIVVAERRRLTEAIEQVHHSAKLLGLDPLERYAPFAVRADAWLWRTRR